MIVDLFSKRRKRALGDVPDVYRYDDVPAALRVQIVHVLRDSIDAREEVDQKADELYRDVHDLLAREYGVFELHEDAKTYRADYRSALFNFFLSTKKMEQVLDVVEVCLRCVQLVVPTWTYASFRKMTAGAAIDEVNQRFREHGIGYQYESGEIIRVDSQLLHAELVKPVLTLLARPGFEGPNDEFLKAHEHYRHARYKEALVDALKALESTLKVICEARGWKFESNATAKTLLEIVFDHGLIPSPLQAHFGALRSTLESGIPTVRNKLGGHGQGPEVVSVPAYIVEYGLNLSASAIRLLVEAHGTTSN